MRTRTNAERLAGRLVAIAVVATATLVGQPERVAALHCAEEIEYGDKTVQVEVECTHQNEDDSARPGGGGGAPRSAAEVDWNVHRCNDGGGVWVAGNRVELTFLQSYPIEDGTMREFSVACFRGGALIYEWAAFQVRVYDSVIDATTTLERLRDDLVARVKVQVPVPVIATSPPVDSIQLVGIWGWFWVEPDSYVPLEDSAAEPGRMTVTLNAEPGELRFYPGDDAVTGIEAIITCEGPGLAWRNGLDDDATDCKHFWDWPSKWDPTGKFVTRAEVDYVFTWEATGPLAGSLPSPNGTIVPGLTVVSQDTPLKVIELQAVGG